MKRLFITSIIALSAAAANAQSVSVKAGVNFSNVIRTNDDDFETEFKPGIHAGLGIDIPLTGGLSFAPEVLFSQKGYKITGNSLIYGETESSTTTNFVDVPILAKFKAGRGFNIHLGPQVSFLTSTTYEVDRGNEQYRTRVSEENGGLRKNILGGVVGAGFDISPKLNLHGRYGIDFQKNENGDSQTPEFKNQVIQVGLGVRL